MNRKAILLGMALTLLVVGTVRAMSGGGFSVPWSDVAGGGDERTSSQYRVRDTIGQGAIGVAQGDDIRLRAGYWNGVPLTMVAQAYRVFWQVVAAEGGRASGAGYRSGDTTGQVAIGESAGSEFRVKAGYWPGAGGLGTAEATPTPGATPTATATATPTPLPGGGYIAGQVDLQGRGNDGGALARAIGSETYSATSGANGAFRIEVVSGTYTVTLSHDGYLYARRSSVSVSSTATTTLSAVRLLGGDAVADNAVDIYDLTLIGAGFGTSNVAADITGDGAVNIYDLVLVGANFGRAAPLAWP